VHPESKYCLATKKVLDVQNLYSLLSNSTYLNLLSEILITHNEALVVTGHKVLYALFMEADCQTDVSQFSMLSFKLSLLLDFLLARNFFRCRNRWKSVRGVIHQFPFEWSKQLACSSCGVWTCLVVQKHNSRTKHAAPFVLYWVLQLVQGFTICCCVDCHALWKKYHQQKSLPVPELSAHDFSGRHDLFGGPLPWVGHTKPYAPLQQVPECGWG
jgi:hypothetical protein